ncbi:MAG: MipA/OmpV family protein [Pseudomonadales bacterium]
MGKYLVPLALLASVGVATQVSAEEESDSMFALGLGVSSEQSIYTGVKNETNAMPFFMYENGNFYVQGPELGYNYFSNDQITLGVAARYRMDGYAAGDSAHLAGMKDRDGTAEVGLTASYETNAGEFSIEAFSDAGSKHKGYQVDFGWEKEIELSQNWSLTPEATIGYQSAKLNDYYYGVKASEATANRAAYKAKGGTVYEVGVSANYMIDENQMLNMGVSYAGYGKAITDSSIVEDKSSVGAHLLYMYRF